MFQPVADFKIACSVNLIAEDALFPREFLEPAVHELSSVFIVGKEKAREHPDVSPSPPRIIHDGEQKQETKPRISRDTAETFRLRCIRLNRPNPSHNSLHFQGRESALRSLSAQNKLPAPSSLPARAVMPGLAQPFQRTRFMVRGSSPSCSDPAPLFPKPMRSLEQKRTARKTLCVYTSSLRAGLFGVPTHQPFARC